LDIGEPDSAATSWLSYISNVYSDSAATSWLSYISNVYSDSAATSWLSYISNVYSYIFKFWYLVWRNIVINWLQKENLYLSFLFSHNQFTKDTEKTI
jgi:hypothetical protein